MIIHWWIRKPDGKWGSMSADISQVVRPSHLGIDEAYAVGCEVLHQLIQACAQVESLYADTKYRLYQEYTKLPKNKEPVAGTVNPGTDSHFTNMWLPANKDYQQVREMRSQLQGYVDALRMTYLPRLKVRSELWASGERHSTAGPSNDRVQRHA